MSERPDDATLADYLRRRMRELDITSQRELGRRVNVSPETARRLVTGGRQPDEATLRKVAERLPASLTTLRRLAGKPTGTGQPFTLPPEADQLDHEQRTVILSMIHVLLRSTHRNDYRSPEDNSPRIAARRRDPDG